MLTIEEKHTYLKENIIPSFMPLVSRNVYSIIFDYDYKVLICTESSAKSVGFDKWEDMVGLSFRDHNDPDMAAKIFGDQYRDESKRYIHEYAEKIHEVQKRVFTDQNVISFLDLLPYKGELKSYIVTYVPIFHPSGEVIAIQSFAARSRFFSHKEYFNRILDSKEGLDLFYSVDLTTREHEIMFLLANGSTQDQISQILKVSRSTIANIIANQLCVKFGIFGANTKLLTQKALQYNLNQTVPPSLYRPYMIVLDEKERLDD